MQPTEIVKAVRSIVGPGPKQLHKPDISWREKISVTEALATGYVADGPFIRRFEDKLCEITGAKYAVAVSSGTAALHLACIASGFGPGDDIECPSLTFVATANAVRYCHALPFFTDFGDGDLPATPHNPHSAVKETRKIIAVQLLGRVRTGNIAVEDACQALGSVGAGRQGTLGCFSFNGNKIATTGGGGAVVTDDETLAAQVDYLSKQAKDERGENQPGGFNYRLPNLNAALGLAQLERLPEFLEGKQALADRYARVFGEMFWKPPQGSNNWLNAIRVRDANERDATIAALNADGLESRPLHTPLHLLPMYRDCPRSDMSETMKLLETVVCLPSGYDCC